MGELVVNELFSTLQGEGVFTGRPSVFVRFQNCNLDCSWCDTSFTWNGTESGTQMSENSIVDFVQQSGCTNVVLTGGEPLLNIKNPSFHSIVSRLKTLGYSIEVETNGTVCNDLVNSLQVDHFNVSPKLRHSGVAEKYLWSPSMLHKWNRISKTVYLKFVVDCSSIESAKASVGEVLEATTLLPFRTIYLMPEGTSYESQILGSAILWKALLELKKVVSPYDIRMSVRMHTLVYGNVRGV